MSSKNCHNDSPSEVFRILYDLNNNINVSKCEIQLIKTTWYRNCISYKNPQRSEDTWISWGDFNWKFFLGLYLIKAGWIKITKSLHVFHALSSLNLAKL